MSARSMASNKRPLDESTGGVDEEEPTPRKPKMDDEDADAGEATSGHPTTEPTGRVADGVFQKLFDEAYMVSKFWMLIGKVIMVIGNVGQCSSPAIL